MELITVTPDDVLTIPGQGIHIPELLQAYYTVAINGDKLPPAVIAHKARVTKAFLNPYKKDLVREFDPRLEAYQFESDRDRERAESLYRLNRAKECYKLFHDSPAQYLLFDGTHRSTALTLCNQPINALLITCAADVKEIKCMTAHGKLPGFFAHSTSSITKLAIKFMNECRSYSYMGTRYPHEPLETVRSRVDKLVERKEVPKYMIKKYLGK